MNFALCENALLEKDNIHEKVSKNLKEWIFNFQWYFECFERKLSGEELKIEKTKKMREVEDGIRNRRRRGI